ncbi:MAG: carboxypeptidase-like regulatory domain-containing protein, partial [Parafilimonas sp.]
MKKIFYKCMLWSACLLFYATGSLLAQAPVSVKGAVTAKENTKPLEGVTVMVEGTKHGVTTNADGSFTLSNVPSSGKLVFSFVGYKSQTIPINGQTNINVALELESSTLDQVVVIGYGTQQRKDLTGAVAQLKASQLENENPTQVTDMLRGNVAGLNISQTNSASAKGGGDLQIRGRSSINAGTTPLIVVDGVIYPGSLSDINPNDINTIDVLKDATSAAVFGAKSASGVIIITTKKGSRGKPQITLNSNFGYGELAMNQPI